ncbi:MAG TPA: hypothetical protein VL097_09610 [Rhodanobacter sp.]|jgi:hypothetical protein|nr:hypothetical protein [Rhodanobacter sp.]
MTTPDNQFEQRARELWNDAAQRLDPATAGRLRAARRQALEAAQAPTRRAVRWLIPTGAFAVIALATMMVWQPLPQHRASTATQAIGSAIDASADLDSDLPPDADQTDPTLYQNLDFYGWLAANNHRTATR